MLFQLVDRTQRHERRKRLGGLVSLGADVQAEHADEAIFATLARGLERLGFAWLRMRREGQRAAIVAAGAPDGLVSAFESVIGVEMAGLRGPLDEGLERVWREGHVFVDDMPLAASAFLPREAHEVVHEMSRSNDMGRGIAVRIDVGGQPAQVLVVLADFLREEDVPAFGLLGAQVSSALDTARVIADLSARNEDLAALNRIAGAAGAASDLPGLFGSGVRELLHVLGCKAVAIYLIDPSRETATLAHLQGGSEEAARDLSRMSLDGTHLGIVAHEAAPHVWVRDDYSPERRRLLERLGQRTIVSVPLIAHAEVIGVMNVGYGDTRDDVGSRDVDVVQAAAAHFAAAVQAKRLLDDLRKSYADLARTQEQLVQRERLAALGELAAVVAHEIRNPLGVVFNSVGAIRRLLGEDDRARQLVEILDEEATRMNHIVGDLLDLARPVSPALRRAPLQPVVQGAIEAACAGAEGRVQVDRQIEEGLPAVPIDERLMRQAILNVAINAVQAMGDRGGTLTVRMRRADECVCVEIHDTGPGIAPEAAPRIFEPFFTTRASGTGLGLTVVKRIVDVHRGETAVDTSPGRGTTFVIRLPVDESFTDPS